MERPVSELHVDILAAMCAAALAYGRHLQPTWTTHTVAGMASRYRGRPVSFRAVARCLGDLRRRGSVHSWHANRILGVGRVWSLP